MNRWLLWLLVLAGGVGLWWLYPSAASDTGHGRTEVTIWFNGPIEARQLAVIDAFEKKFPECRVVLGSSAARTGLEGEGNPQRLMCGIAGGVPPEVVEYDRFAICQWASRKAFLDLNPLIEQDRRQLEALRAEPHDAQAEIAFLERYQVKAENYYPQTWNECVYQGGQFGIPNYMDDRVMYFNADLLVQNGLVDGTGKPKPPDTWEQVCLKRADLRDVRIESIDDRTARVTVSNGAAFDFTRAGIRPGDTVSHVSASGVVTRCVVKSVASPRELIVVSPYRNKSLSLPALAGQHIKVFNQDSYALRLSRWDDAGRMKVVGFEPQHGNGWLYMYGWMNGGEFLSPDGKRCTLNDPRVVEALQWTTDVYDALGGVQDVNAFKKSFQPGAQDPFFLNQIGLFINGDWFLRDLARYARDMKFGTWPPPVPSERLKQPSGRNFTWVAGFAYCIPSTCPPAKLPAAWALVKFLSSVEGGMVMNEHDAQRERGQGRLYMPRLVASIPLNEKQLATYIDIPQMPEGVRKAMQTHIELLASGRFRPVTPEGKQLWDGQANAQNLAWNHKMSSAEALDHETRLVQQALDRFYHPAEGPRLRWGPVALAYLVILVLLVLVVRMRHRRNRYAIGGRGEWIWGLLFASPWMIGFIVLAGGPILFSAVMSLTHYDVLSEPVYVGARNYEELVKPGSDPLFYKSLGNTLFMGIGVPLGMAVGLGLALLLNTKARGMSIYRTLFFLPAIMPVVAASILWIWVFDAHHGLMNWMLQAGGIEALIDWVNVRCGTIVKTPIPWLTSDKTAKPALIIMGLWGAGAGMIIWLAGLQEIPVHLYEAAALDGAGFMRRFVHITLPMLSPYILFNLVMGLIATFQIFTQSYIMTPNGDPGKSTYFYVYKLFDESFSYFRLGYGAAMAWILFVIVIVLTLVNLVLSRKWVYYAGE